MRQMIALRINGEPVTVPTGTTVAAAILSSGAKRFRRAVHGEPRAALCGMGICFECRVAIDGKAHARSCQVVCAEKMEVRCDD
jgi:predicted molibdopterin-dependent oxidoreductase YjgC